ncbi:hypothetical protein K493DRAFT_409049 [Basidiobolus meristosporus CBS 931.73]|uniref:Uncharacterized protein n=1 Tax=Basidiobolus meristosporus CBS 931.73 TaxID=1314790 RepID=A0A1Y1Y1U3_9FUNG|nr:hypothetical protein K493DRAFT_409049 [Basidiobolus meristosporus CBS 931.73]|eukprot:ORX91948.1 hypothetical protein K493DRAFT_409049 [Basidiobolus meristosporus CBS 931.73]
MVNNKGTGEYDIVLSVTQGTLNNQLRNMWLRRDQLAFPKTWDNESLRMDSIDDPSFKLNLDVPQLEILGQNDIRITFTFTEGSKLVLLKFNRSTKQVMEEEVSLKGYTFSMRTNMVKTQYQSTHGDLLDSSEQEKLRPFQENQFTIQSLFMDFTNVKAGTFEGGAESSNPSSVMAFNSVIQALINKLKGPEYAAYPFLFGVVATQPLSDKGNWTPTNFINSTTLQRNASEQSTLNFLMTINPKTDINKLPEYYPEVIQANEKSIRARLLLHHKHMDEKIKNAIMQSIRKVPGSYGHRYNGTRCVECSLEKKNGDEGGYMSAKWEYEGPIMSLHFHSQRTLPIWGILSAVVGKLRLYGDQDMKYEAQMSDDKGLQFVEKDIGPLRRTDDDSFWKKLARGIEVGWTALTAQIGALQQAVNSLDGSYRLNTMLDNVLQGKGFEYILLPGSDVFQFQNPTFLNEITDLQIDAVFR